MYSVGLKKTTLYIIIKTTLYIIINDDNKNSV